MIRHDYTFKQYFTLIIINTLLLLGTVYSNEEVPRQLFLSPNHSEVVRYTGVPYIVTCEAKEASKVRWLNPRGNEVSDYKGRLHSMDQVPGLQNSRALIFEHVITEDSGIWTCDSDKGYLTTFTMIVHVPISFEGSPIVQEVREDTDAIIKCRARGDPMPTINWYVNGIPIKLPHDKYKKVEDGLLVKKVNLQDGGEYICRAVQLSTTHNDMKDHTITLKIQHKPIPVRKLPTHAKAEEAYGYITGQINLTCEARAEPAARFTWLRRDKLIPKGSGRIYEDTHISVLEVIINDTSVFGDYICKASNNVGTMERIITLIQGQKPLPPSEVILRGINADTMDIVVKPPLPSFKATPSLHQHLPIKGYRFQYVKVPWKPQVRPQGINSTIHNSSDNSTLHDKPQNIEDHLWNMSTIRNFGIEEGATYLLTGLDQDTWYAVRVQSRSAAGYSEPSSPPLLCHTLMKTAMQIHASSTAQLKPSFNIVLAVYSFIVTVLR